MGSDRSEATNLQAQIARLNQIGIALSSEHNLNKLLELIVTEARRFTVADGGSLYIKEGEKLNFLVAQTESLEAKTQQKSFKSFYVPLTKESISGYVATTGKTLNLADVYHIPPTVEYRFNKEFDRRMGYRSKSMLTVPMRDHNDEIIGVLQLVNSLDLEGRVVPFRKEYEALILSLASQAAVAIRNAKLIEDIKSLFRSLVRYSAKAIDSRSPHTAGHSGRVAKFSLRIAQAINEETEGVFANIKFTPEQLEELRMAGWLHDIGKIGVKEAVLEKGTKLNDDQMETLNERFALIRASLQLEHCRQKAALLQNHGEANDASAEADRKLAAELEIVDQDLEFLRRINIPEVMQQGDVDRLRAIAEKSFVDPNGEMRYYLTSHEYENLAVLRGNLTASERKEVQRHVEYTMEILRKIPFTKDLENIPTIAAAHHEMLDGSGYPQGLKGDDIPLQARIMCISDIYDALSSKDRPYKKAMPLEKTIAILQEEAKRGKLDSSLIELFVRRKLYEGERKAEEEEEQD
jgi:HD-GYP domain-containing protein (c-di-GMP phosphodiesterase class II)